mgnify:CR=1 FL=1|tara:strand:- start:2174 stop:2449 length:276 start_codon:yes stop_codon:yes gene_type:complete
MKIGDLVEINSSGRKVIWTEPFRDAVGIVTDTRPKGQLYVGGEYIVQWTKILPEGECSQKFQNKYWWNYNKLSKDWVPRVYLKHVRRRKKS